MHKIDGWITDKMQDGYLWLLDRTGCYCPTVSMFFWVASISLSWPHAMVITLIFTAVIFLDLGLRYYLQGSGSNQMYNSLALGIRNSFVVRMICNSCLAGFFLGGLVTLDWRGGLSPVLLITFNYTLVICIRDREKKPFFEPKMKMATQGF